MTRATYHTTYRKYVTIQHLLGKLENPRRVRIHINSSLHRPVFISLCVLCVLVRLNHSDSTGNDITDNLSRKLGNLTYPHHTHTLNS